MAIPGPSLSPPLMNTVQHTNGELSAVGLLSRSL